MAVFDNFWPSLQNLVFLAFAIFKTFVSNLIINGLLFFAIPVQVYNFWAIFDNFWPSLRNLVVLAFAIFKTFVSNLIITGL